MLSPQRNSPELNTFPTPTLTKSAHPPPEVSRKNNSTSTYWGIHLTITSKHMSSLYRTLSENYKKITTPLARSASGCTRKFKCTSKKNIWWLLRKRDFNSSSKPKTKKSKFSPKINPISKSNSPNSKFNFKKSKPPKVTNPSRIFKLFPHWNNSVNRRKQVLAKPPDSNKTLKHISEWCHRQLIRAKRKRSELTLEYALPESSEIKALKALQ